MTHIGLYVDACEPLSVTRIDFPFGTQEEKGVIGKMPLVGLLNQLLSKFVPPNTSIL